MGPLEQHCGHFTVWGTVDRMFLPFLYIVIKVRTDKNHLQISEQRKKAVTICFVSLVWSLLCMQFNVQFAFRLQYHKTHNWYRTQIKAEAQARTLSLFCCFAFVVAIWGFGFFVLLYMACLPWDAVVALFNMQQFLTLFDKHLQKSIHDAHSTLDIPVWTFFFSQCPTVERADSLVSQWHWFVKVDCCDSWLS